MPERSEKPTLGVMPSHPKGEERRFIPVDFWPGEYVVLPLEEWNRIVDLVKERIPEDVRKDYRPANAQEFEAPDSGPRICPYCGMDFWMHRGRCRMMYVDPNDPDAEY
jgi:hypothetical protein